MPTHQTSLNNWRLGLAAVFVFSLMTVPAVAQQNPIVIAHRGASGYLPEHTLEAASMAYAMQVDFIEQDVVLTKDNIPIVLHDIHLDTVTDVAKEFPGRAREDGRFYAIDFTWSEIQRLSVHERISLETGKAVFPKRFDVSKSLFHVPTLAEEIELIQGLNGATNRDVGIYVEIKKPAWHRQQKKDISKIVLDLLSQRGYKTKEDNAYLQCFDPKETRRIREELKSGLKLVQLIADNEWKEAPDTDFEQMRTEAGIAKIAEYADGIGPWMPHILEPVEGARPKETELVPWALSAGLVVHPFTFRKDSLPAYADTYDDLLKEFFEQGIDGLFTDFPDLTVKFRSQFKPKISSNASAKPGVPPTEKVELDGLYKFTPAHSFVRQDGYIGTLFSDIDSQTTNLTIEGSKIKFNDGKELHLVTNLDLPFKSDQGFRLCCLIEGYAKFSLTPKTGRCWFGKFKIEDDVLTLRFPHTCNCSRTGLTFNYIRQPEKKDQ